jgi:hypothetical protein
MSKSKVIFNKEFQLFINLGKGDKPAQGKIKKKI